MEKQYKEFGLVWTIIFFAIFLFSIYNDDSRYVFLIISSIFLCISVIKPSMLAKFYELWIKLGNFIGSKISKVILFILFYGLFTPVAIVLKILGKDLLNKKLDQENKTYWIEREEQPQSMKNQF